MDSKLILNRIIEAYSLKNDAELALFLGITPQNLSNWRSQNTINWRVLFNKCVSISYDWLLTGEGPMLKSDEKSVFQNNRGGKNSTNISNSGAFFKSDNNIKGKSNGSINTVQKKEVTHPECAICKEKDKLIESLEKQIKLLERLANINND